MKLLFIAGTRPNFVKIAPLIAECKKQGVTYKLLHTGQHHDKNMSYAFFNDLNIPKPDIFLNINSPTPKDLKKITAKEIAKVINQVKPDCAVVVGDSDATCAGAIAGVSEGVDVAHVEAGLRSFFMAMPEERNRIYIDKVAKYMFVTEISGMRNLKASKAKGKKFLVGNVMIDSLMKNFEKIRSKKALFPKNTYAVATLHRKSNVHNKKDLAESLELINFVAEKFIKVVMPIHPRTRNNIKDFGFFLHKNINALDPLGYLDFQNLLYNSRFALTDSGGLQDETTFYHKPCLTLRDNTERPITYIIGSSVLVGRNKKKLEANVKKILAGKYKKGQIPKFWDGNAAYRIIKILKKEYEKA